jgi:predicted alpha/beta hydrolase
MSLPLIACSLDASGQQRRLREWAELLCEAAAAEQTAEGARYVFVGGKEFEGRIRALAAAEHDCCAFLEFGVVCVNDRVEMTVTAPVEGLDALRFIFTT